jgi:hypothetical protein
LLVPGAVKFAQAQAAQADRRDFGSIAAEPPFTDLKHRSSPFCQSPKSSTTQSAAQFCKFKWGGDALVTRCVTGDDRHFGTADPKRLGE